MLKLLLLTFVLSSQIVANQKCEDTQTTIDENYVPSHLIDYFYGINRWGEIEKILKGNPQAERLTNPEHLKILQDREFAFVLRMTMFGAGYKIDPGYKAHIYRNKEMRRYYRMALMIRYFSPPFIVPAMSVVRKIQRFITGKEKAPGARWLYQSEFRPAMKYLLLDVLSFFIAPIKMLIPPKTFRNVVWYTANLGPLQVINRFKFLMPSIFGKIRRAIETLEFTKYNDEYTLVNDIYQRFYEHHRDRMIGKFQLTDAETALLKKHRLHKAFLNELTFVQINPSKQYRRNFVRQALEIGWEAMRTGTYSLLIVGASLHAIFALTDPAAVVARKRFKSTISSYEPKGTQVILIVERSGRDALWIGDNVWFNNNGRLDKMTYAQYFNVGQPKGVRRGFESEFLDVVASLPPRTELVRLDGGSGKQKELVQLLKRNEGGDFKGINNRRIGIKFLRETGYINFLADPVMRNFPGMTVTQLRLQSVAGRNQKVIGFLTVAESGGAVGTLKALAISSIEASVIAELPVAPHVIRKLSPEKSVRDARNLFTNPAERYTIVDKRAAERAREIFLQDRKYERVKGLVDSFQDPNYRGDKLAIKRELRRQLKIIRGVVKDARETLTLRPGVGYVAQAQIQLEYYLPLLPVIEKIVK